jgi:DNA-binding NarL/FixJ family response regulator
LKSTIHQKKKINVFIVDPQPVFTAGLELVLSRSSSCRVNGTSLDYKNSIEAVKSAEPHVLVMDIFPGTAKGIDFIIEVLKQNPGIKVLVLSMLDENIYAERALKAGASGYIMKTESPETIILAIERIFRNELCLSENISSMILQKYVGGVENIELDPVRLLSDRELEVYRLTGKGLTSREISSLLEISVNTVDNHKSSIKDKLGLKNSIELIQSSVLWSRDKGIL